VWRDGKVISLFFEGYVLRRILSFSCLEESWEIGNGFNENNNN